MIFYLKKISNYVLKSILVYLLLLALSILIIDKITFKHSEMLLLCSFLLIGSAQLFTNRLQYYLLNILFIIITYTIIYIKVSIGENLYLDTLNRYTGFYYGLFNLLLFIIVFIKLKIKYIISFTYLFIILLPIILISGYFFSANTWLGTNAVLAILQTNYTEALGYVLAHINIKHLFATILFISILIIFSYQLSILKINYTLNKIKIFSLIIALLNIFLIYKCSNNIITAIYNDTKTYILKYNEFKHSKLERKENINNTFNIKSNSKGIYILVIGESANKDHLSAYGYQKDTTPWLKEMVLNNNNSLLFTNSFSCYSQTVPALSYALTAKNQYNNLDLAKSVSLLEVAEQAGYDTVWLSNQVQYSTFDTPITIIADEANQQKWINTTVGNRVDITFYDVKLVETIDQLQISDKMLIIIHLMGSHAPYEDRYPSEFAKFGNIKKVDRYDNSILYTDFVLQKIYERVQILPNFKALIYFSDHREAIDQDLEHDEGNFVFDMVEIPMYMYFSDEYIQEHPNIFQNLKSAQNDVFTNDLIFNTMLGIMDINIENLYEPKNDLTSTTYDKNIYRFKTLYNKKNISEAIQP